jgi:hypothetical protein
MYICMQYLHHIYPPTPFPYTLSLPSIWLASMRPWVQFPVPPKNRYTVQF